MLVLINEYEKNGYDDSDGIALCYDRTNNKLVRFITWTTRGVINTDRLAGVELEALESDLEAVRELLKDEYIKANKIHVGDNVNITRGRKYPKGDTFVVTNISEFRDRYGRVLTTYIHSEFGIKININNCDVLEVGEEFWDTEMVRG
jgi:hypothetical protein